MKPKEKLVLISEIRLARSETDSFIISTEKFGERHAFQVSTRSIGPVATNLFIDMRRSDLWISISNDFESPIFDARARYYALDAHEGDSASIRSIANELEIELSQIRGVKVEHRLPRPMMQTDEVRERP